jgi:hypothetical protein
MMHNKKCLIGFAFVVTVLILSTTGTGRPLHRGKRPPEMNWRQWGR